MAPLIRYGRMAQWRAGALCLALGLLLASAAGAAEPIFPKASRIGLAPPPGFVVSAAFPGFQHNDKHANIVIAELPGYAFEAIEKEVAAEIQRNPAAISRHEIEVKDAERAFLLSGVQTGAQGPVLKWTLVATARDVTALVTALIPEAVQEVAPEAAIREAFASLTIRASVPLAEQLSVLPFALNDLAGFRIVRVQPGAAAMLTDGPKDAIEMAEQPLMLITIGPSANPPPPNERDGLARRMIGETPGLKDMRVINSEPLRIANQPGHQIMIEAKDGKTGAELQAVQWLRFGAGTLLRMVGIARKDAWDETFNRFRQIRDGVGPR